MSEAGAKPVTNDRELRRKAIAELMQLRRDISVILVEENGVEVLRCCITNLIDWLHDYCTD